MAYARWRQVSQPRPPKRTASEKLPETFRKIWIPMGPLRQAQQADKAGRCCSWLHLGRIGKVPVGQSAARPCCIARRRIHVVGNVNKSFGISLGSRAKLEKGGDRPWLGREISPSLLGYPSTETYYYNFLTGDYSYLFPNSDTENLPDYRANFTSVKSAVISAPVQKYRPDITNSSAASRSSGPPDTRVAPERIFFLFIQTRLTWTLHEYSTESTPYIPVLLVQRADGLSIAKPLLRGVVFANISAEFDLLDPWLRNAN
ncbi:hypothetical protein MBM_08719 [Drepanopeziza brunnea f. sp. 'multigermtubi' MB_m1]|uniref:Uncharacterized protein n=1 Tax=Marssonina brunnea f. sp. multigermtubi (strain MB_m1) TaxID=1072389 RepID=K1WK82_MARBU|nr:uncharacterized protein MBM_08719 [Drepanopeziza brunnea f. sp. 'multigermtubi' MB_m1]EKD13276.1 hypothetical protein MBM_08719 [Drepanopeziza brunnea f. sp. 'multigermtubi' MB_m1]